MPQWRAAVSALGLLRLIVIPVSCGRDPRSIIDLAQYLRIMP
jgi:hypothetical protein